MGDVEHSAMAITQGKIDLKNIVTYPVGSMVKWRGSLLAQVTGILAKNKQHTICFA